MKYTLLFATSMMLQNVEGKSDAHVIAQCIKQWKRHNDQDLGDLHMCIESWKNFKNLKSESYGCIYECIDTDQSEPCLEKCTFTFNEGSVEDPVPVENDPIPLDPNGMP